MRGMVTSARGKRSTHEAWCEWHSYLSMKRPDMTHAVVVGAKGSCYTRYCSRVHPANLAHPPRDHDMGRPLFATNHLSQLQSPLYISGRLIRSRSGELKYARRRYALQCVTLGVNTSARGTQGLVVPRKRIVSVREKLNFWNRHPEDEVQPSGRVWLGRCLLPPLADSKPLT